MKNVNNLPIMNRTIASAIVISDDGYVLFGRKAAEGGGVYADCWHIPGGGVNKGESLKQAMIRELDEEVVGLSIDNATITPVNTIGRGESEKTKDGVKYWCIMEFNRFIVQLNDPVASLGHLRPGDDFVEIQWFARDELSSVMQIPGGYEFFKEIGLIDES